MCASYRAYNLLINLHTYIPFVIIRYNASPTHLLDRLLLNDSRDPDPDDSGTKKELRKPSCDVRSSHARPCSEPLAPPCFCCAFVSSQGEPWKASSTSPRREVGAAEAVVWELRLLARQGSRTGTFPLPGLVMRMCLSGGM